MKAVTDRATLIAAAVTAFFLMWVSALGAIDAVSPFFERIKDRGTPVAGQAQRDGSAQVDVLSTDTVTRFRFDTNGRMTSAPCPDRYRDSLLSKIRISAADAVKRAVARLDVKEAEIRAVTLADEKGVGVYYVFTYDVNHKFICRHRLFADSGRWDGSCDAAGEKDPLQK